MYAPGSTSPEIYLSSNEGHCAKAVKYAQFIVGVVVAVVEVSTEQYSSK